MCAAESEWVKYDIMRGIMIMIKWKKVRRR